MVGVCVGSDSVGNWEWAKVEEENNVFGSVFACFKNVQWINRGFHTQTFDVDADDCKDFRGLDERQSRR